MSFVRHEPCPRCRQIGYDKKGNNLARYSDGSGWCFSCSYREPPTIYRGYAKKPDPPKLELSEEMPVKNQRWLEQYLSPEEIKKYFKWSHLYNAHVFTHVKEDGSLFWEARSIDPKAVKTGGEKPMVFFGDGRHLVVVEDVVSAIKVGRHMLCMPLFGSHMKNEWIAYLGRNRMISRVTYWLDEDKKKEAIEYARKSSVFLPANVVFTVEDPKECDDDTIKEVLDSSYVGVC